MDNTINILRIKVEKAKALLPEATQNAIAAVDWRAAILEMRTKFGYSFEQLGDLEIETELVLCGLVSAKDYPKEIAARMQISRAAANELVNEMNELVFKKIKEELIKNTERKKSFQRSIENSTPPREQREPREKIQTVEIKRQTVPETNPVVESSEAKKDKEILSKAGIEIVPPHTLATGDQKPDIHPMLAQKLSTSIQMPTIKTEHTIENITKSVNNVGGEATKDSKMDPYREIPE